MCWATVTAGRNGISIPVIKTCVWHYKLDKDKQELLSTALSEIFDRSGEIRVHPEQEIEGIRHASEHISLVAKYQLGLAAAASGAGRIAEQLLIEVIESDGSSKRYVRRARRELSVIALSPWINRWPIPGDDPDEVTRALKDSERSLGFEPQNPSALALHTSALFILGRIEESKKVNKRIEPIDKLTYSLNSAVFSLMNGQYDAALMHYRRAAKKWNSRDTAKGAEAWLTGATVTLGPMFHFGLAFILDHSNRGYDAIPHFEKAAQLPLQPKAKVFVNSRLPELRKKHQDLLSA